MKLVVDSGHSQALALNVGSQESVVIPSAAVETRIGTGATGEIMGHVGRIPWLENRVERVNVDPFGEAGLITQKPP